VSAIVLKMLSKWSQINKTIMTTQIMQGIYWDFGALIFFCLDKFFGKESAFLANKSIFRFGDLKRSKDVKLTEYILIGTLLSFGSGILCAMVYKYFAEIL
jgi:glucose uptake protein GlcU